MPRYVSGPMRTAIVHFEPFDQSPQIYGADVVFEGSSEPVNTGLVNAKGQPIWRWSDPKTFGFVGKK